jgi:arylsulfatase A-like enzyme
MVSRATLLTGQYMSRHAVTEFNRAIAPEAFTHTYPGLLRRAGYWTGYVGKYGVGQPRQGDFNFLRAYEGTHWMAGSGGERVHVTEKNARDAIAFLQARPKDRSFALTVGFFAPHAEDSAPEQYLPQDWSARLYEGVTSSSTSTRPSRAGTASRRPRAWCAGTGSTSSGRSSTSSSSSIFGAIRGRSAIWPGSRHTPAAS